MTDTREQIEDVLYREGVTPIPPVADAIMALLTSGARFTGADGKEMVVVPVDASEATISTMVQCGLSARLGEAYLWPDYMRDLYKIAITAAASEPDASQASERGE